MLAAAVVAVWIGRPLPASLSGLRALGPYALLTIAVALAWWFNRGRAFVLAASLLGALAAYDQWHTRAVYVLLAVVVPFNILVAMARAERGARYRAAYFWLGLLALEAFLVFFLHNTELQNHLLWREPPTLIGRLAFAVAFAAAVWRVWPEYKPLQVGATGALVAFFIAFAWPEAPGTYAAFMAAAGVILVAAVLQESHQLAFRDSLTGLPGRRALEERLRSLGGEYALAMVDVDHFKKFNDTHGHDIGDQVLKLVGARLAQAVHGGTAYRYGGEEFSVVFPGVSAGEAARELESVRAAIEGYGMAVRAGDRPRKPEEGEKRRGEGGTEQILSVTVSIGVAEPSGRAKTPLQVIKVADEALYRAKRAGRNCVSR